MNLNISAWVSTRTYNMDKTSSISYIFDEKKRICYVLKGKISDLWEKVVELQNYNVLKNFAVKNGLETELQELLYELQEKELIQSNYTFMIQSSKHLAAKISMNDKYYSYFSRISRNLCIKHNYLPMLYFILNYDCDLKCKHCFIEPGKEKQQIKFEDAKVIIDEAFDLGISRVYLTGGEASINKDFIKIAEYVRKKHLQLIIFTNAQKLYDDKILLDKVISIFPSWIQISLYSTDPDIHDKITGQKGSCKKTIKVINYLREKDINVDIACYLTKYNSSHYKKVEEYALSIGAKCVSGVFFLNNSDKNNSDVKVSKEDMEKYFIDTFNQKLIHDSFEPNEKRICSAGVKKLCIAPNLDILPCVYFNYVLGNYKNISLSDVRKEIIPKFKQIFISKNLKDCFKYDYCKHCIYCSVYCDKFMKKSKSLCETAQAYQKAYLYYKSQTPEM